MSPSSTPFVPPELDPREARDDGVPPANADGKRRGQRLRCGDDKHRSSQDCLARRHVAARTGSLWSKISLTSAGTRRSFRRVVVCLHCSHAVRIAGYRLRLYLPDLQVRLRCGCVPMGAAKRACRRPRDKAVHHGQGLHRQKVAVQERRIPWPRHRLERLGSDPEREAVVVSLRRRLSPQYPP